MVKQITRERSHPTEYELSPSEFEQLTKIVTQPIPSAGVSKQIRDALKRSGYIFLGTKSFGNVSHGQSMRGIIMRRIQTFNRKSRSRTQSESKVVLPTPTTGVEEIQMLVQRKAAARRKLLGIAANREIAEAQGPVFLIDPALDKEPRSNFNPKKNLGAKKV